LPKPTKRGKEGEIIDGEGGWLSNEGRSPGEGVSKGKLSCWENQGVVVKIARPVLVPEVFQLESEGVSFGGVKRGKGVRKGEKVPAGPHQFTTLYNQAYKSNVLFSLHPS